MSEDLFGLVLAAIFGLALIVIVFDLIHRRGDCEICREAGVLIDKRERGEL